MQWGGSATGVLITESCHGPCGDRLIIGLRTGKTSRNFSTLGHQPDILEVALRGRVTSETASHREQQDENRANRQGQRGGIKQHFRPVRPRHIDRQAAALFLIAPMSAVRMAPPAPPATACEITPLTVKLPVCAAATTDGSSSVTT